MEIKDDGKLLVPGSGGKEKKSSYYDLYSIYDYLTSHPNVAIAFVSGMVATVTFSIRVIGIVICRIYQSYWNINVIDLTMNALGYKESIALSFLINIILIVAEPMFLSKVWTLRNRILPLVRLEERINKKTIKGSGLIATWKSRLRFLFVRVTISIRLVIPLIPFVLLLAVVFFVGFAMTGSVNLVSAIAAIITSVLLVALDCFSYSSLHKSTAELKDDSEKTLMKAIYRESILSMKSQDSIAEPFRNGIKQYFTNKQVFTLLRNSICVLLSFAIVLICVQSHSVRKCTDFQTVCEDGKTYVILYHTDDEYLISEANWNSNSIIINTAIQRIISKVNVDIVNRHFDSVEKVSCVNGIATELKGSGAVSYTEQRNHRSNHFVE